MNLAKFSVLSLVAALVLSSCKNDLKLNAPYKEMPSIYAVLSGQENVHVIRINKVFLGEGDANAMAKVADSVNYPAGELTITLDRYDLGSKYLTQLDASPLNPDPTKRRTITFHDSLINTTEGAFSTTQRVYVSYDDLHQGPPIINSTGLNINPDWRVYGDYILTVKNNRTGNVFKAKSTIVDSVTSSGYKPLKPPYYPSSTVYNDEDLMDYSETEKTYSVRFNPNSAQIYQLIVRMHFYDSLSQWNINRYVDYVGNNLDATKDKRYAGQTTSSYLLSEFKGKDIFSTAGYELGKLGINNEVFGRKLYMIQYFIYSSTQDYADYLEFVKPSLSISQNKPLYSNFENRNALGIFTFRARHSVKKMVSRTFISAFSYDPNTCKYLFFNADLSRKGCP